MRVRIITGKVRQKNFACHY